MIARKADINPKRREVRLPFSFGSPDIKRWLKEYLQAFADGGWTIGQARRLPFEEVDMRQYLERNKFSLIDEAKWSAQLSGWTWAQWIAQGYLTESGSKEGVFYASSKALSLVKWREPSPDDEVEF